MKILVNLDERTASPPRDVQKRRPANDAGRSLRPLVIRGIRQRLRVGREFGIPDDLAVARS
jgi:hypothetical protein